MCYEALPFTLPMKISGLDRLRPTRMFDQVLGHGQTCSPGSEPSDTCCYNGLRFQQSDSLVRVTFIRIMHRLPVVGHVRVRGQGVLTKYKGHLWKMI